jgi:hypothetical protein
LSSGYKVLEEIRGMRALMAMERDDGALLYASEGMDINACSRSVRRLWWVLEKSPEPPSHITFNTLSGIILVYFVGDKVITVHVDQDFDVVALHSQLREIVTTPTAKPLAAAVKAIPPVAPTEAPVPPPALPTQREGDRPVTNEDLMVLVEALHIIATPAKDELGIFVASNALRNTRDPLLRRHRCLFVFIVGKNGNVMLQDVPKCTIFEASDAVAAWANAFLKRCNDVVPAFPPEFARSLLDPLRNELSEIGFLDSWDEAAAKD